MTTTRRAMLRLGMLATAGLSLGSDLAHAAPRRRRTPVVPGDGSTLATLGVAEFEGLVYSRFTLQAPGSAAMAVRLVRVSNLTPSTAAPGDGEVFTLTFQPPRGVLLPQALYTVRHDALGEFELLLTHGRIKRNVPALEAVINRYIPR